MLSRGKEVALLSRWPIRNKLIIGLALLIVIVATASGSGLYGLYAYRNMIKSVSSRANELPLATALIQQISDLRVELCQVPAAVQKATDETQADAAAKRIHAEVQTRLKNIDDLLTRYRDQLDFNQFYVEEFHAGRHERKTFEDLHNTFEHVESLCRLPFWPGRPDVVQEILDCAGRLEALACDLPAYLHGRMQQLASDVRGQYRSLIYLSWITTISGGLMLALLVKLFYDWVFRPLRVLIKGSRRVAAGQFHYRIVLDTKDEMAELAEAMNDMTARFQAIRDDLDRQVQERTKQVVRSEQLASVGFLAAGVAHEINNPLASIAMCAESLESRLPSVVDVANPDQAVVRQYLGMIQSEAFRCKEITERLLDFSRMGDIQRQPTELRELVRGVIDMVGHLGKYQDKRVELLPGPHVVAMVNAQEMKQVVLNLLTNGLDCSEPGGTVQARLSENAGQVELLVVDTGSGMTPEVLTHLFEPFFTRKRGGQGTGLGLSITYRIVADHGGHIEATSEGPGRGSRFRVTLPKGLEQKETRHHNQAA